MSRRAATTTVRLSAAGLGASAPLLVGPLIAVAVLLYLMAGPLAAGTAHADGPGTEAEEAEEGLRLLDRAAQAGHGLTYSGVQFVAAWDAHRSSTTLINLAHTPARGTVMDLDGDEAYVPLAVAAPRDPGLQLGLDRSQLGLLRGNYRLGAEGGNTVCGRSADVVVARRTNGTVAARFWVDRDTGLMLRREARDGRGRITQASAFLDLKVGDGAERDVAASGTAATSRAAAPWSRTLTAADLSWLRRHGWAVPGGLPDGLRLLESRSSGYGTRQVVHLRYSDGLATLSLFVQRGRLDTTKLSRLLKAARGGATVFQTDSVQQRVTWAARGHVYTLLADTPSSSVDKAIRVLPHEPEPGFWDRVSRGLSRLASWANPFG
ncbi:MAG: hypothetical protein GEV11_17625 [Streptosporangiales bacterium]|nr:hypothetical protein [Streptosporangiales bacterium]